MDANHIFNAAFTPVWDGDTHAETPCKVGMDTKEVFDIGQNTVAAGAVAHLNREHVTMGRNEYPVVSLDKKTVEKEFKYA